MSLQRAAAAVLDDNARQLASHGLRVRRLPMPDITSLTRWDYYGKVLGDTDRQQRVEVMAKEAEVPAQRIREKLESQNAYTYRTYLNSVLLVTRPSTGNVSADTSPSAVRRVMLVPRYPDLPDGLEGRIESAYRQAYGDDLEIVFIDAESLAHGNGSLRCIVCPIPEG